MPAAQQTGLRGGHGEREKPRHHSNRRDESGQQDTEYGGHENRRQQVVFQMHPPAAARNAKSSDSSADQPVEQIDQRAQRTQIAAKPAGNEQADGQDCARRRQRPDPLPGGNRGRKTDQRIKDQEELGVQPLPVPQRIRVMGRPVARLRLAQRPGSEAFGQLLGLLRRQRFGWQQVQTACVGLHHAERAQLDGTCHAVVDQMQNGPKSVGDHKPLFMDEGHFALLDGHLDRCPVRPLHGRFRAVGPTDVNEQPDEGQQAKRLHDAPQWRSAPTRS